MLPIIVVGSIVALAFAIPIAVRVLLDDEPAPDRAIDGAPTGGGGAMRAIDAEPSGAVRSAIEIGCVAYGIPKWFGLANAACESRFHPNAGLFTIGRADLPEGTIPERSVGLMQVNVNPTTPTGRSRISTIKGLIGPGATDADVLAWLRDPVNNVGFWAGRIVIVLAARADREGRSGLAKWEAVRVWLAAGTLSPERGDGLQRVLRFRPVAEKWIGRTGGQ